LTNYNMNIRQTIKKVLKEEIDSVIERYVNKYYSIDFNIEVNDRLWGYTITINLYPKDKEIEKYGNINFYSTWKILNGKKVINYDTNSSYNTGGVFRVMGLVKELNDWLYKKSKEYIEERL